MRRRDNQTSSRCGWSTVLLLTHCERTLKAVPSDFCPGLCPVPLPESPSLRLCREASLSSHSLTPPAASPSRRHPSLAPRTYTEGQRDRLSHADFPCWFPGHMRGQTDSAPGPQTRSSVDKTGTGGQIRPTHQTVTDQATSPRSHLSSCQQV